VCENEIIGHISFDIPPFDIEKAQPLWSALAWLAWQRFGLSHITVSGASRSFVGHSARNESQAKAAPGQPGRRTPKRFCYLPFTIYDLPSRR